MSNDTKLNWTHVHMLNSPRYRAAVAALAICFAGVALPGCTINGLVVEAPAAQAHDDAAAMTILPLWFDSYVDHSSSEQLVEDLWSFRLGVLVVHTEETLSTGDSTSLSTALAWSPRRSIVLRRLGSPERLLAAPHIRERYNALIDFMPGPLGFEKTVQLPDGRFATMGVSEIIMAESLPEGMYEIRLNADFLSRYFNDRMHADGEWHMFYLRGPEDEPKGPLAERVPWSDSTP